jgi:hypothetical protein
MIRACRVWKLISWCVAMVVGFRATAAASDLLVVYGAGSTDLWGTELTFSNTTGEETNVGIFDAPLDTCHPNAQCYVFATVPPRGTFSVEYRGNLLRSGIGAAYIFTGTDPLTVSVQARAHQLAAACATVDLPVLSVATLEALNPETLVLPGARRGMGARSNLLVANVFLQDGLDRGPLDIGIEAFTADGSLIGQASIAVPYGETQFINDVLGTLGVAEVANGQVRVTKLSGDSVMWAMMPITRSDGSLSISLGVAP